MVFTFQTDYSKNWKNLMLHTHSLRDFQGQFIYPGVQKVLEKLKWFEHGWIDHLRPNTAYLLFPIIETSFLTLPCSILAFMK